MSKTRFDKSGHQTVFKDPKRVLKGVFRAAEWYYGKDKKRFKRRIFDRERYEEAVREKKARQEVHQALSDERKYLKKCRGVAKLRKVKVTLPVVRAMSEDPL
jgi:hypothetical protein